ncbi:MAG TPA: hypothetical protein VD973_21670 [Symbiobacteriaceae bacterium]|nr:hypothetical protein [Symbiobacteriaceae bacterium]
MLEKTAVAMTMILGVASMVSLAKVPWYKAIEETEWFFWVQMIFSGVLLVLCLVVIAQRHRKKGGSA